MKMIFNERFEFTKEFVRLAKRYRSLPRDLDEFKRVLSVRPLGAGKHFNVIARAKSLTVVKARFFCEYLRGSSLRIIYSYVQKMDEDGQFVFIEIYFKGEKVNEDRERIKDHLKYFGQ